MSKSIDESLDLQNCKHFSFIYVLLIPFSPRNINVRLINKQVVIVCPVKWKTRCIPVRFSFVLHLLLRSTHYICLSLQKHPIFYCEFQSTFINIATGCRKWLCQAAIVRESIYCILILLKNYWILKFLRYSNYSFNNWKYVLYWQINIFLSRKHQA